MRHCPYYKNREVFDGFNEIITSLGGKAMTEEEFKSSLLRNQREGLDYSAMELAYRVYNRNGGNLLDMTPDGKPSMLFLTLLDHFKGDKAKAIVAKSNVYSDEFFNWFGDWTSDNKKNVSEVVDENGEPLVVWHSLDEKEFKNRQANWFSTKRQNYYGDLTFPVYLNIKNIYRNDNPTVQERALVTEYGSGNEYDNLSDEYDGAMVYHSVFGYYEIVTTRDSTQVKHIENLGTWDSNNANIYYLKNLDAQSMPQEDVSYFTQTSLTDSFGQELSGKLMNGETVSSRDLMNYMIDNMIYHPSNIELARALSRHDVPVRIGYTMKNGEFAKTASEGGGSVIYINPNELSLVSRGYASTTIMHELVHAVTVDIIDNPKTEEDRAFVESNRTMYRKLSKGVKHLTIHAMNAQTAMYAFENEKEFAAVFASDQNARLFIYEYAERLDRINGGNKFINSLKKFINRLVKAFGKRALFDMSNQNLSKELRNYENSLFSFLKDASVIERGNIPSKSRLGLVYDQIDQRVLNHEDFIENMKDLERMGRMQENYLLGLKPAQSKEERVLITSFEDTIRALLTRISAIKGSVFDSVTKGRLILQTETQIQMFLMEESGKYVAINHLLKTAVPQLLEDLDRLRKIHMEGGKFTNSDYMYHRHANAGMYGAVFNQIVKWLLNNENVDGMIEFYNKTITEEDKKLKKEDIDTLLIHVQNAATFADQIVGHLDYMLKTNGILKLREAGEKAQSPDMEKYIEVLASTDSKMFIDDIGLFESLIAPADSSSNEAIRAVAHMINTALNKAQTNSFNKSVDLLILLKGLKRGEKAWHCYETDETGNFTGYLIRDLNFGRFKRDYDAELVRINTILLKKFGLTMLNVKHNRTSPEGEDGQRTATVTIEEDGEEITREFTAKEFFDYSKEMWLIDHCERRYTAEYYKKYAKLPQSIKTQLLNIKTLINAITSTYEDLYDEKNIPHYEKLSDDDWIKLNLLWERRRFLAKDVDEFGHQKEGAELEAAKQLQQLYEEFYHINDKNKKDTRERDIERWKAARNEIINLFGEDSEQLEKWDERNSKKILKTNEFGEVLVFKEIEKEFGSSTLFYSDRVEELKEQRKKLLSSYRMLNGEYDGNAMSVTIENAIHTLDEEINNEKRKVKYGSTAFASRQQAYAEILKKHIKFVESAQLKRARRKAEELAKNIAMQEDDDDPFTARSIEEIVNTILAEKYGTIEWDLTAFELFGEDDGEFRPYRHYTRMEAVNPEFMETIPNDGWVIDKKDKTYLNDLFDESYGEAWVPKRSIYDNSEKYKKVMKSDSLKAMYYGLYQTIKEANDIMNLEYQDDYMLPQVECTSLERLGRKGTLRSMSRIFGWGRFYGRVEDPNDEERADDYQETSLTPEGGIEKLARTYPDGRDYHSIPRYFTKKLEHPELLSKNAVGIVWDYYRNALKYKERNEIKDDCEMIADLIKNLKFNKGGRVVGGEHGTESTTYQFVRNLIERDLYDIHRVKLFSKTMDFTKLARLLQRLTTARNLGMSPKVAMVGFFTTMYTHMMNGITGYKYSFKDMSKSLLIVLKEFGLSLFGAKFLGQRCTKNKIMKLLEILDMADQGSRKLEHSNRNSFIQFFYKNSTFGLMTGADVIAKATILVATLLSYRLVDGKFMTRHEIEESRVSLGEKEYNRLMQEFKKSKINAYNAILGDTSVKEKLKHPFVNKGDTKLNIKPEYEIAWEDIKDRAMITSMKNAEDADGIATRLQKAMMTRNAIGAFILIHRQYIPLMLSKIFGKRVYDYDTHEYKNGQFRTMFEYINLLACSNTLASTVGGMFAGLAFGGFGMFPIFAGGAAAAIYSTIKQVSNKRKGIKRKTLKLVNLEFLGGKFLNTITNKSAKNVYTDDAKTYANQIQNKYQLRQTMLEVLLYNVLTIPVVNAMCMCADSTDKDDDYWKWLLLQTMAYWARATLFETNSKYNMLDLASAIKTGTAAFGTIESYADLAAGDVLSGFGRGVWTIGQNALFGHNQQADNLSSDIYRLFVQYNGDDYEDLSEYAFDEDYYGKSGAYKGKSKLFKALMKTGPYKNMYELLLDPASKRKYQENQIMRMSKKDKQQSWVYDLIFKNEEEE